MTGRLPSSELQFHRAQGKDQQGVALLRCEDGLIHYCSQQRGYPGKPLAEYSKEDIRREYVTEKACAPFCPVSCVHYISYFDFWRGEQTVKGPTPQAQPELVQIQSAD